MSPPHISRGSSAIAEPLVLRLVALHYGVWCLWSKLLLTPCCRSTSRISDISVIRRCWNICSLCSESNNTNRFLRFLTDVLVRSILFQIPNIACSTTWQRVLGDRGGTTNRCKCMVRCCLRHVHREHGSRDQRRLYLNVMWSNHDRVIQSVVERTHNFLASAINRHYH